MSKKQKYFKFEVIFFPDVVICQHFLHLALTYFVRLHTSFHFCLCFFYFLVGMPFLYECLCFNIYGNILLKNYRRKIKNIENQYFQNSILKVKSALRNDPCIQLGSKFCKT